MPEKINQKSKRLSSKDRQKRTFVYIAIPLPPVAKEKIESFVNTVPSNKYSVSWADPNQAKIMLLTMGSLAAERVEDAIKAVEKTASSEQPFGIKAEGLGYFAKERSGADPTIDVRNKWIVYLDIPDNARVLRSMYKNLFRNLTEEAFFPPVHFNPRVTLGSLAEKKASREERENILEELITNEELTIDDFLIDRINIYQLAGFGTKLVKSVPLGTK
jgi:2'-5' RNA ligase